MKLKLLTRLVYFGTSRL